jgi:UDP-3-O-[3-hydroxymyristoyl] glucosamine N-acyltransferase
MQHPGFFERAGPFSLGAVAEAAQAKPAGGTDLDLAIRDVRPLDSAAKAICPSSTIPNICRIS